MRIPAALIVVVSAVFPLAQVAEAAHPGQNGKIAYEEFDPAIHSVNPDGSGATQLTTDPNLDSDPSWSPDGQRMAFTSARDGLGAQVYVMNADGSGQTRLTDPPDLAGNPDWSPDGQRIVFSRNGDLWTMNSDGSNQSPLASLSGSQLDPAWSPDGSRIAFVDCGSSCGTGDVIYTLRPDGTGLTQITGDPEPTGYFFPSSGGPDWSPDGKRIAYLVSMDNDGEACYELRTIDADATGRFTVYSRCDDVGGNYLTPGAWSPDGTLISAYDGRLFTVRTNGTGFTVVLSGMFAFQADWQPLPDETTSSHIRPKSATPFRVPLVPAAKPCTAPNRSHGPPLAFGSCNPVQPGSSYVTVGVGDGSPALARSTGSVRMDVQLGAPGPPEDSDVAIRFSLTNVMRASDLSEYTGELRSEMTVRRTDRDGLGFAPHSTSTDVPFGFAVPCTPTPGSSLDASSCVSFTSVNAVIPLAVKDTNRAVWALDTLRVYDGGPDEDGDTEADNSLFMTQGVFVP